MKCNICGMNLKGFVYYEKKKFRICYFCYKGLKEKDEDGKEVSYSEKVFTLKNGEIIVVKKWQQN